MEIVVVNNLEEVNKLLYKSKKLNQLVYQKEPEKETAIKSPLWVRTNLKD